MEKIQRILTTISIIALLLLMFFLISQAITRYTGFAVKNDLDSIAECLQTKDITLYLNSENPSNDLEKLNLKEYESVIKIKNCMRDPEFCNEKQISNFPSWIVDGTKIDHDISLDELKEYSGCK